MPDYDPDFGAGSGSLLSDFGIQRCLSYTEAVESLFPNSRQTQGMLVFCRRPCSESRTRGSLEESGSYMTIHIYTYTQTTYTYIYIYIYIYIHTCTCVCVYIYIYTYARPGGPIKGPPQPGRCFQGPGGPRPVCWDTGVA